MKSGGGGDGGAGEARAAEEARQARVRAGTTRIDDIFNNQFNNDFYGGRQKSYLDYATPQLTDQYGKAKENLTYWLDRNGTLDSSIRASKEADLQKLFDTNKRAVSDQALSFENGARTNVENARADLIRTLSATADDQGAVNQALSRSQSLSAPDAYVPLADLFTKFTSGLRQQGALETADNYGGRGVGGTPIGRYNTGLFGINPGAVKNTP